MLAGLHRRRRRASIVGSARAGAFALLALAAHAGAHAAAGDVDMTCSEWRGLQGMLAVMADGMTGDGGDAWPRGTALIEEVFCEGMGPIQCEAEAIELCRAFGQFADGGGRLVDAQCGTALAFVVPAFLKESGLRPHCEAKGLLAKPAPPGP